MELRGSYNPLTNIEGIRCHQVLEHLTNIIPLMNDCFEAMKKGAEFEISVPHKDHWEAWADPTHKRYFVEESFLYFTKDSPFIKEQGEYQISARFTPIEIKKDGWRINVVLQK